MRVKVSVRFWTELILGAICAVTAVALGAASIWPQWIESVFGADPDKGSGAAEWAIATVLFALAVTLCLAARREWKGAVAAGRSG